jgi:glycosidase
MLDQRKQAKMQWIQYPNQSNADNLNNVRRDVSRHFRNKKKAYLKAKFEELVTNSRIKNIRNLYKGINDFKKSYQPRTNVEKGNLVTDSRSILVMWRNYFSQLLNVHGVNDAGQTKIHTAEQQAPEPSASEIELGIEKLKSHKSSGIVKITIGIN